MNRLRSMVGDPLVDDADRRVAALRIVVCGYATIWSAVRAPHLLDTIGLEDRRLDSVGVLAWLDRPVPAAAVVIAVVVTPLAGAAATVGWRYRVTAPLLAIGFLLVTTYRNSWGQIFHTENLTALHLLVLAVVPADRCWAPAGAAGRRDDVRRSDATRWAVEAMALITVSTYFVAGMAKLRNAGLAWVDGDVLLHQVSFDNARKDVIGDPSSPLAALLAGNSWITAPAAWASMVVELGAPLALLGRRLAALWCSAAWLFHVAILALMAILFPYHLTGIALAPLLPIERIPGRLPGWSASARRLRAARAGPVPSTRPQARGSA